MIRQYLKMGGRLLGFNVDPSFSKALDARWTSRPGRLANRLSKLIAELRALIQPGK
jgi:hypothetical protein